MRGLATGFLFFSVILVSSAAQACDLVTGETGTRAFNLSQVRTSDSERCSVAPLSLSTFNLTSFGHVGRASPSFNSANTADTFESHWASGLDYRWKADLDRAVDHVFKPPRTVNVHVTQTHEDERNGSEFSYKPNSTLGAIEFVIH